MYSWTEKRIAWYQRAIAYTRFDERLADAIVPFLPVGESVCDLGCGTGYAAMELARRGYRVTALDQNELTMNFLRGEARKRGLSSLDVLQGDWFQLEGARLWDNVVMVFAGHLDTDLKRFLRLAGKRLILVTKNGGQSHVQADGVSPFRHATAELIEQGLSGYRYEALDCTAEFGQPFLSEAECREYIRCFGGSAEAEKRALRHAVRLNGGEDGYSLYLPNRKQLRIYAVETDGNSI